MHTPLRDPRSWANRSDPSDDRDGWQRHEPETERERETDRQGQERRGRKDRPVAPSAGADQMDRGAGHATGLPGQSVPSPSTGSS